jgi:DNA-binding response OmpR family regulator
MSKRILAVEDDADILFIVEYILTNAGYEVYTSEDGENLIEIIDTCHPDLILLDIRLPKQDGRLLCKEIKAHIKAMPVVLMSAHAEFREIWKEACADDFISKPFDINYLIQRIQLRLAS